MNFSNLNSFGTIGYRGAEAKEFYSKNMSAKTKKKYSNIEINNEDLQKILDQTDPLDIKAAIKNYIDEKFTGLTDEEIAKIKEEIEQYLKDNSLETEADVAKFNRFVKKLYKDYGFKGDLNDIVFALISKAKDSDSKRDFFDLNIQDDFKKFSTSNLTLKNKILSDPINESYSKAKSEEEFLKNLEKRVEELFFAYL